MLDKKAYIIKVDGTQEIIDHQPTLEEAQNIVGGWVEWLPKAKKGITAFGDEEGRLNGKAVNETASRFLGYEVVGNIIIMVGWKTLK